MKFDYFAILKLEVSEPNFHVTVTELLLLVPFFHLVWVLLAGPTFYLHNKMLMLSYLTKTVPKLRLAALARGLSTAGDAMDLGLRLIEDDFRHWVVCLGYLSIRLAAWWMDSTSTNILDYFVLVTMAQATACRVPYPCTTSTTTSPSPCRPWLLLVPSDLRLRPQTSDSDLRPQTQTSDLRLRPQTSDSDLRPQTQTSDLRLRPQTSDSDLRPQT
ncbi:MAG: hypothetical protein GY817_06395, partial [bacterium]|nr:hypothetical protein [bacterium]